MSRLRTFMQQRAGKRGLALLVVLVALIAIVTMAAALLRIATTHRLSADLAHRAQIADSILLSLQPAWLDQAQREQGQSPDLSGPILSWLEARSASVVLPPDVQAPRVHVLGTDAFDLGGHRVAIRITGWDQCGMAPTPLARGGSSLRRSLPASVRGQLDALSGSDGGAGLDTFSAESEVIAFPSPTDDDHPSVLGATVATHNVNPARINVNTAPLDLVEEAFRATGRGGIEVVRSRRAEGEPAPIGARNREIAGERDVELVTSSDTWSFRIDIQVDNLKRSSWEVWTQRPDPDRRNRHVRGWRCVQRLFISD